jgi:hypothetical protein
MFTRRLFLAVASLVFCACSDSAPTGITVPADKLPIGPRHVEMVGIIVVPGSDLAPAYLRTTGGLIALQGADAFILSRLDGAEAAVRGTQNSDPGLTVESFTVLRMHGRPVLDGMLEFVGGAYALRLATGEHFQLVDAPEALSTLIGARIWVAPADSAAGYEFGVIRENQ